MANEDPSGIPQQARQHRPVFIGVVLAVLIATAGFFFVLSMGTEKTDIERNEVVPDTSTAAPLTEPLDVAPSEAPAD